MLEKVSRSEAFSLLCGKLKCLTKKLRKLQKLQNARTA